MNESQFRDKIRQRFPGITVSMSGFETYEVRQDGHLLLDIGREERDSGVTLVVEPYHAHCETLNEAFDLGWQLLTGDARWAAEFRNEDLAQSWFEVKERGETVMTHFAYYFTLLDGAEWTSKPGDRWLVRRSWYAPGADGVELTSEVSESPDSMLIDRDPLTWLEEALGPPVEGFRWTNGAGNSCILQVPRTWRSRMGTVDYTDFVSEGNEFLRVMLFYREPSRPPSAPRSASIRSSHMSFEFREQDGWFSDRYEVTFEGDTCDMLALIELYWPASEEPPTSIRDALKATVPQTRMVPAEWNMGEG